MDSASAAPEMAVMAMDEEMPDSAKEAGDDAESILVRSNYDPLALFAPEVRTDENGQASVTVTLPDNLTRYRVMVVAVAGRQVSSAQVNRT